MYELYSIVVSFWELIDKLNDIIGDDIVLDFFNYLGILKRKIGNKIRGNIDFLKDKLYINVLIDKIYIICRPRIWFKEKIVNEFKGIDLLNLKREDD